MSEDLRFGTLGAFAGHLFRVAGAMHEYETHAMERAAKIVEKEAKRRVGTYQDGWADLAESTLENKAKEGFATPDPLLAAGALRDSIEHHAEGRKAEVGSNSDVAVYQELGTGHIPPRSFLATAAHAKANEVADEIGGDVVMALVGKGVHKGRLDV